MLGRRPQLVWAVISIAFFTITFIAMVYIHHRFALSKALPDQPPPAWQSSLPFALGVSAVTTACVAGIGFGVIYGFVLPAQREAERLFCPQCGRDWSMRDADRCPGCGAYPPTARESH